MHGNVWEWCIDLWDAKEIPIDNTSVNLLDNDITIQLLNNESSRALRGGSWNYDPRYCRGANRYWDYPDNRDYDPYGVRVVCRFPRL
jgi:formylglycine-generating enzyme required for sulfatase activity